MFFTGLFQESNQLMNRKLISRAIAACALAIAVWPHSAPGQDSGALSISGTFRADYIDGVVGDDLATVFANGADHGWTLTLYGVSYVNEFIPNEWSDEWSFGYEHQSITRVHATSFDFQFVGADADILNQAMSDQLTQGGLANGAFLELRNHDYFDSAYAPDGDHWASWSVGLTPLGGAPGLSFGAGDWGFYPPFTTDDSGFPLVTPQRLSSTSTTITDFREATNGSLVSLSDLVDIGSTEPPYVPPTLRILDAAAAEGNRGASRVDLQVKLSRDIATAVSVNYSTANGTAIATKDYTAASGTLTFQPGETSRTISITLKTDRKREPNETFYVQLSGAAGADIADGAATVTILNDD